MTRVYVDTPETLRRYLRSVGDSITPDMLRSLEEAATSCKERSTCPEEKERMRQNLKIIRSHLIDH